MNLKYPVAVKLSKMKDVFFSLNFEALKHGFKMQKGFFNYKTHRLHTKREFKLMKFQYVIMIINLLNFYYFPFNMPNIILYRKKNNYICPKAHFFPYYRDCSKGFGNIYLNAMSDLL